MIEYKTSRGTSVKVKVENSVIVDLTVNGIEVVKGNSNNGVCYLTKEYLVINSSSAYKKLGSKSVVRIEMNEELVNLYNAKVENNRRESERILENVRNTKANNYTFENHMNNKNNF